MTEHEHDDASADVWVDAFAARLREADPPDTDAALLARRAMARAKEIEEPPVPSPVVWLRAVPSYVWAAAAMTALAFGAWAWTPERSPTRAANPAAIQGGEDRVLADGHRVVTTPETRWTVTTNDRAARVDLQRGEALFVVEPLTAGATFVVVSGGHRARVVGTVFLVRAEVAGFAVEVLEGRVEVDGHMRLPSHREGEATFGWAPRLLEAGRRAARARAEIPSPAASSQGPAVGSELGDPAARSPAAAPTPVPATEGAAPPDTPEPPARPASLSRIREALARRQYESALSHADFALRRWPRNASLHQLRGDALRGIGRGPDALQAYRTAVELGRGGERASIGLTAARLASELGRPDEARELLRQSGATLPASPVRAAAETLSSELAP